MVLLISKSNKIGPLSIYHKGPNFNDVWNDENAYVILLHCFAFSLYLF